jgi:hypothetical protein
VIEPPNAKEIPCATIKSHLQAPTIQTGQTRENNITFKKMWQKKSLAKLQSDTLGRQELQKSQSMQSTIDFRADFSDMAFKPKATINQRPRSVTTSFHSSAISPKNSGNSGGEFDTKITCDLQD